MYAHMVKKADVHLKPEHTIQSSAVVEVIVPERSAASATEPSKLQARWRRGPCLGSMELPSPRQHRKHSNWLSPLAFLQLHVVNTQKCGKKQGENFDIYFTSIMA